MMNTDRNELARSFGSVADAYDSARPDYPEGAANWLVEGPPSAARRRDPEPRMVLELGAGTGRLTEHLTAHRLVATDPSHEMLLKLRDRLPRARVLSAAAEQIPMPSRAFDVVVAAQAFHWFDHATAMPEIARVLRPDGHLALVWNIPDESTPWVRKLQRIVPRPVSHDEDTVALMETPYFGHVEEQTFRSWRTVTRESLLQLVQSRSPYAVADEETKEQMLADVGALYDDYDRGTAGLQMPYVTRCYRARVVRQDGLGRRPAPRPGRGYRRPTAAAGPGPAGTAPAKSDDISTTGPAKSAEDTRTDQKAGQRAPIDPDRPQDPPTDDDGTLLIDFR